MSSSIAMSPAAIAAVVLPPASHNRLSVSAATTTSPKSLKSRIVAPLSLFASRTQIKRPNSRKTSIRCDVAVKSTETDPSSSPSASEETEEKSKVGSRVRVIAPLKVYHVNRVAEVELEGKEGKIKDYVGIWKGKRISANLPYKVEFSIEVEGRGLIKFVAHLKEDEFEFIDP